MKKVYLLCVIPVMALALLSRCSNPKKPFVSGVVVQFEINVTASVKANTLTPNGDIDEVKIEVYRGGTLVTLKTIDYSKTHSFELEPEFIEGDAILLFAKAYSNGAIVNFGYKSLTSMVVDSSLSITMLLNWTLLTTKNSSLIDDYVYSVCTDKNNNLWIATYSHGVGMFDGTKWTEFSLSRGLPDSKINVVFCDQYGTIWTGTNKGLAYYTGTGSWKTYLKTDGLIDNRITTLYEDRNGVFWVGTMAGASVRAGTTWTNYKQPGDIRDIFHDDANRYWFATYLNGIVQRKDTVWTTYTKNDGLTSNTVWSLAQLPNGGIIAATSNGISLFDGLTWTADKETFPHMGIYDIGADKKGVVWTVNPRGVSSLQAANWTHYQSPQPQFYMLLNSVYIAADNTKWFTTGSQGMMYFQEN